MKTTLIATTTIATLALATPALAATGTYAGDVTATTGKIALDVKLKRGQATKITFLRGAKVPTTCEISGLIPEIRIDFPVKPSLAVDPETGKFKGEYTQPTYGNVSTIRGRFDGNKVSGKVRVNYHYMAEAQYPEESCDTGKLAFSAKLGAPDETATDPPARPGR